MTSQTIIHNDGSLSPSCSRLLGYSERGMINALCDDLHYSSDPGAAVSEFLSWFEFPGIKESPCFSDITKVTLLVEQSFSDFGDLDLLILLDHIASKPQAILIEAKVSNYTTSWLTVEDRWDEFEKMLDGGEWNTSNLFVQLHRKVRLVDSLTNEKNGFISDPFTPRGSRGQNGVVDRAFSELQKYVDTGDVWYGAILPDTPEDLESFARETLQVSHVHEILNNWNTSRWGFLSWQTVDEKTKLGWPRTQMTFDWNQGQIYRFATPTQHSIQAGQVYLLDEQQVYVVSEGRGQECRVVELNVENNAFFWKTKKTNVRALRPCETPVSLKVVPMLPRTGAIYTWDCCTDLPRLPRQTPAADIECNDRIIVVKPSWLTTRVRKENSPGDSPGISVFTHHLRRGLYEG